MTKSARLLLEARHSAGLTQRALATRAGVPQPAVARIERGGVVPRADTLEHLLESCGRSIATRPRLGAGVDRSAIRELLQLTPQQRLDLAAREARALRDIGL